MRTLLQEGQKVKILKAGYSGEYRVQVDYEDHIYIYGIPEPFQPNEIKVL